MALNSKYYNYNTILLTLIHIYAATKIDVWIRTSHDISNVCKYGKTITYKSCGKWYISKNAITQMYIQLFTCVIYNKHFAPSLCSFSSETFTIVN